MFQSTWGQQNQQQPSTSAFGQPAFGTPANTNSAFGSTNTFGQPQQPQVNPMFGNISTTPSTNPGTSAFGTFGSNPNTGTSVFGTPKPATGFGAFSGGTSTFGSGASAFGQPATTSTASAFGQPSTSTSAFGGGSNLFGNKPAFGGTGTPPTVTTGTANPAYAITTEKDGATTLQFQSINCMPAYVGYSPEELRIQDYAQGRKTATTASAFGTGTSAFGTTQPGATNVFGQPAQQPSTSLFGTSTNTNTTGFGTFVGQTPSTNTNNAFGSGGVFGQTQTQPQPSNPFGGAGAFGQQQQQQSQQQQPSSLFGGGATSAFGNNANKPAFGTFGGGVGGFGSTGTTSAFGTNPQQNQPAQGTGLFGTTPSTGTSAFNAFGGNNANKPSIFGTNPSQPATNNPFGGGLFGNNQQQPSQPGTSAFGTGTSTFAPTFGTNVQQNQPTNPLFGNPPQNTSSALANTGTGLFGNTQQNQVAQQPQPPANPFGNLLGQRPNQPNGSLFGNGLQMAQPQQQSSLFGNSAIGQPVQGSSLFGKPAAPALGMSLSGNTNMGQGMFGNSTTTPGIQGTLTASIAQPIGENLPIFDMLPPGPRIISLDQTLPKKKAGFFLDMPTRSPVPRVPLGYSPATSKLRGFGSMTLGPSASSNGISLTSGKPGALVLNKTETRGTSVGPDFLGRSSSPALGSGARQSVKKVILDKKIDPSELFVKSATSSGLKNGKVTFSPQLSVASREKDAELAAAAQSLDSSTSGSRLHASQQPKSTGGSGAKKEAVGMETTEKTEDELVYGDYWVKPELSTLKKAGYDDLSSYPKLVVGRKGYGEIHFLEAVDLTGLPKLGALLGDVVRFDEKECSVYPDIDEADKPQPGSGLNVKARLILEGCWANDKATREPIKDPNHPLHVKHLKKLKNMKNTIFESFDMTTGTWTFTVDHF